MRRTSPSLFTSRVCARRAYALALLAAAALSSFACARSTPSAAEPSTESSQLAASDPHVAVMGRVVATDGALRLGYPGVSLRVAFEGPSLVMRASSNTGNSRFAVRVDEAPPVTLRVPKDESDLTLAEGLDAGAHQVEITHRTETWQGIVRINGFRRAPEGRWLDAKPWPARRLMLIGDSVTSGEGADRPPREGAQPCSEDVALGASGDASYGMLLGRALGAQVHLVSHGGRGLLRDWQGNTNVLNAPQFFQLSIAEDVSKVLWNHAIYRPDLAIVSLGTNDFHAALGAPPSRAHWVAAEVGFVRTIRSVYPNARVILTEGAMLSDDDAQRRDKSTLRSYLEATVRELADENVRYVPSKHYAGDACDAHPTGEQHAAMASDFEPVVREMLGW